MLLGGVQRLTCTVCAGDGARQLGTVHIFGGRDGAGSETARPGGGVHMRPQPKATAMLMGAVPLLSVGAALGLLNPLGTVLIAIGGGLGVAAALHRLSAWLVEDVVQNEAHQGDAKIDARSGAPIERDEASALSRLDHLLGFDGRW